jgi:hypothetical protein
MGILSPFAAGGCPPNQPLLAGETNKQGLASCYDCVRRRITQSCRDSVHVGKRSVHLHDEVQLVEKTVVAGHQFM